MHRPLKRLACTLTALAAVATSLMPSLASAASVPSSLPARQGQAVDSQLWLPPGLMPGFPWLPPGLMPGNPWLPPGTPPTSPPTSPPDSPPSNPGNGSGAVPDGFPTGFQAPVNSHTGRPVGGWGCDPTGQTDGGAVNRIPVLFVHGATRDAHDWDQDRQYFLDHGYSACELWAVSYGYGSMQNPETNAGSESMVRDFAHSMLEWIQHNKNANVKQIDIVSHSLGGTIVRKWLADTGENALVRSFVPIAAPNHGAAICLGPTSSSPVCQEIAPGSQWLSDLNAKGEAPAGIRTMTIYDGTGQYDQIYTGSLAESPALKGATNHPYNREQGTGLDHEGLINGTMALQLEWLQNDQISNH